MMPAMASAGPRPSRRPAGSGAAPHPSARPSPSPSPSPSRSGRPRGAQPLPPLPLTRRPPPSWLQHRLETGGGGTAAPHGERRVRGGAGGGHRLPPVPGDPLGRPPAASGVPPVRAGVWSSLSLCPRSCPAELASPLAPSPKPPTVVGVWVENPS